VIVYDPTVTAYYQTAFDYDWSVAQTISATAATMPTYTLATNYQTTVIAPFTGTMNITCWVNPDNGYAYNYVLNQLNNIQFSIHVEMYSWNNVATATAIANRLAANTNLDATLIISYRRVSSDATSTQYTTVYNAGANVFLSSHTFSYQHAKFWIIDDRYATIFSGNWDGTSLTSYSSSSSPNREWGITFDNSCIAAYFKSIINSDRAIASLPTSNTQYCTAYDACGDCNSPTPVATRCNPGPTFDVCGICGGSSTASDCPNGIGGGGGGGSSSSANGHAELLTHFVLFALFIVLAVISC